MATFSSGEPVNMGTLGTTPTRIIESDSPEKRYMGIKLLWRIGTVTMWTITALVFNGHWAGPTLAQVKPHESEIRPFIGTWTAVHAGTPIIVLHLRSEKGELVGFIQVCSYSVNTETTGAVDVVTDPTLSKNLPINNIKVSGKVQPIPVNKNIPKSRWVAKPPPCQNQRIIKRAPLWSTV